MLLFLGLITTVVAFDHGYRLYEDSRFHLNLPQELKLLISDTYFDLYRFQGHPIAQIESLAATAVHFPLLNWTESVASAASFHYRGEENDPTLPDDRYLTDLKRRIVRKSVCILRIHWNLSTISRMSINPGISNDMERKSTLPWNDHYLTKILIKAGV